MRNQGFMICTRTEYEIQVALNTIQINKLLISIFQID
jgi:hypothetical protein